MRTTIAALLLAGSTLSLSAQEPGQRPGSMDFTITVPVDVKQIPSNVTRMDITCSVMPADVSNPQNEIGHGSKTVAFRGTGSFSGNVAVEFNALPGMDPSLARFYSCSAHFSGMEHNAVVTYFRNGANAPPAFALAPNAPFNLGGTNWLAIPGTSSK